MVSMTHQTKRKTNTTSALCFQNLDAAKDGLMGTLTMSLVSGTPSATLSVEGMATDVYSDEDIWFSVQYQPT